MPRITTFPLDKPFEKQEPTTQLSEIALRLVVNFYSDSPYVIGTATILCGNLLVTARHVIDEFIAGPINHADKSVQAVQLLPGPEYIVWDVIDGVADPASDLALLRLATNPGRSQPEKPQIEGNLALIRLRQKPMSPSQRLAIDFRQSR
ncbi:MAG: hypothetical protein KGL11_11555 [Alphaproteobacteria bacterium]|nr:hypothetical protein [Alphaproteobacteria bacterium]